MESNLETEYSTILEQVHALVERSPICWLAYEQLEDYFAGNQITDDLSFHINDGAIDFVKSNCEDPIAFMLFDQKYVAFGNPITIAEEEPSENMSVRRNRKPIRYSLGYLKEKLSRVRRR
ncbi:hypothetical protein LVD17_03085 [Fulvivirga ulvae]|uniref:hypothetical protein n=1 Tax=Fulvivirga ulvae TaxID=2904245 RepID=UPI001F1B3262|nr:hypothetical protein [Fulvivirga ulvae]UII32816.1 hypothetical protein LVD17_03085 [Fulvivirga ulvae]